VNDRQALLELVQRYADGLATADEVERLQTLLRDDAEARREFRHYLLLDAELARLGSGLSPDATVPQSRCTTDLQSVAEPVASCEGMQVRRTKTSSGRRRLMGSLAALCVVIVTGMIWFYRGSTTAWATVLEGGPGVSIESHGVSRPARAGDRLRHGDVIAVTDDATARVRLVDFGAATLGPGTRLQRPQNEPLVELSGGFAEFTGDARRSSTWRIRTPQAEATTASSDFSIASAEGRTSLRVAEGRVHFTSLGGASKEVGSGKRAVVERDSSPVVTSCRSGTALLLTSRRPIHTDWDKFNQLVTEKLLNARLWQMGFRVDVRHYEDVQASDLADRAIVIVSLFDYGIGEPALERIDLAHADVPVICLEPAGYPQLGMSAGKEGISFGFRAGHSPVDFVAPDHPLAAGLHGVRDGLIRSIIGWGRPLDRATTIAHLPDHPEHAVIFAYDSQQMLHSFPAPARRVGLFLDPSDINEHSHHDWRLLEAAVNWCVKVTLQPESSKGLL
jgi:ferric-dicitrate binding protein FerR (iron transport regulator)